MLSKGIRSMQLDKIVNYHKALADPTRVKILILLADGELNGQRIAEKLGVTPATITHHVGKLAGASLINQRREKNTIYFSLNHYFINNSADATANLIYRSTHKNGGKIMLTEEQIKQRDSVIRNFFTPDEKLKNIPSSQKKKLIVLEYLVSKLDDTQKYTEQEINAFIQNYHEDYATIRREFIIHHFMYRENEIYEINPIEMWNHWSQLK